jgi:membrane-bound lytic murein transglycosylase B
MKRSVILTLAIAASMTIAGMVAVHAKTKTVTPPKTAEFTAYEATLDGDKSKVKSVIVLYDNRRRQEFILVPGYGMIFRWQDSRSTGE